MRRNRRVTDVGELQLRTLEALSRVGEGTVYDVLDQFPEAERPRYTTALTALRSLEKRGLVTHRTEDRAYVFRPVVEAQRVRGQMLRNVLDRVFNGSPRQLVATLLEYGSVTPEELAELRALMADREAEENDG